MILHAADLPLDAQRDRARPATFLRLLLIAIVLAAAVVIVHLTPIRGFLADAHDLRQTLARMGAWLYPLTILAVAVLVPCGIPRLALCVAGGMVFGFWWGLLLVQLGTLLGHYLLFLLVRWGGRDWALARWPKLNKWSNLVHDQGIAGVVLIRQLPAHSLAINLALGLSRVKHRHFLIGTAIGVLPEAIPATLIGAGLVKTSLAHSAGYLVLATVAFAVFWIAGGYAFRSIRRGGATATI
jgi:uncharacterized membrane protein YdjX (TVP38/TMEM64 family)